MRERKIVFAATIASLLMLLDGCTPLTGIDIHDRLSLFINELNAADRSAINSHFDQALTQDLPLMDAAWWNANFPVPPDDAHAYAITLFDYVDPSNVVASIMGPPAFNSNTGLPRNAVFVMSREGADMFIQQLFLDLSSIALIR